MSRCEYLCMEYRTQRSTGEKHEKTLCLCTHEPCLVDDDRDREGCTRRVWVNMQNDKPKILRHPSPSEATPAPLL